MKLKIIRCSICENWHLPGRHCPTCGAHKLGSMHVIRKELGGGMVTYVEIVRGIPLPVDKLIERVIRRCQEQ